MTVLTPSNLTALPRFIHDYEDGVSRLYMLFNTFSGPRLELIESFKTTEPVAEAITDELNDACESSRPPNLKRWTKPLRAALRKELTAVAAIFAHDLVAPPAFDRPAIECFDTTSPDQVTQEALARQNAGMLPIITNCLTAQAGLTYRLATYPGRLELTMEQAADIPPLDDMELISRTPIPPDTLAIALAAPSWSQHAARAWPAWLKAHPNEIEADLTAVGWIVDIYKNVPAVSVEADWDQLLPQ